MITKISLKILFFISFLLFISCSTSDVVKIGKNESKETISKKINDIDLNIEKTVCWINLMPGSSAKFHISGKFSLPENENYNLEEIELKFVKVYQENIELYFIQPKVVQTNEKFYKEIIYSTLQGLALNKNFNKNRNVTLELIFNTGSNELKYYIENIKVEEVF